MLPCYVSSFHIWVNLSLTLFVTLGLCDNLYANKKLLLAHNVQTARWPRDQCWAPDMAPFTEDANWKQTSNLIMLCPFYPVFPPHSPFWEMLAPDHNLRSPPKPFPKPFIFHRCLLKSLAHLGGSFSDAMYWNICSF